MSMQPRLGKLLESRPVTSATGFTASRRSFRGGWEAPHDATKAFGRFESDLAGPVHGGYEIDAGRSGRESATFSVGETSRWICHVAFFDRHGALFQRADGTGV